MGIERAELPRDSTRAAIRIYRAPFSLPLLPPPLSLSLESLRACTRVMYCLTFACGDSRLTNQLFLLNRINATITVYVSRRKPDVN